MRMEDTMHSLCTNERCVDALMDWWTKYPTYLNGGVCDSCRYHTDCVGRLFLDGGYCFDGECYLPGCTSSDCEKVAKDEGSQCDSNTGKCYRHSLEELGTSTEAEVQPSKKELAQSCNMLYGIEIVWPSEGTRQARSV